MANKKIDSPEERQAKLAPETHNDEQDDHRMQAQEVSEQAQATTSETVSPLESKKVSESIGVQGASKQDMIDQMSEMESSGRIDMDAYAGEPNHDDNVDKYGKNKKPDGLRGDGT
ncbi:hypothetical protein [Aurantiacibacter sediminis]|uniref:DUF3072 domain-containing protein n=1 Tax=Aurantiacibacter sediminis TaxID=2793064 RepID=A0ABS0N0U1_9SPHN|nr:hypothetical protein [Aurantiacibacter sediminis]MBH5321583.1 hypothetical protein [Aurantiacibacter sediminis]